MYFEYRVLIVTILYLFVTEVSGLQQVQHFINGQQVELYPLVSAEGLEN